MIGGDETAFRQTMDDLAQNSNIFALIWNARRMVYDFQNRTSGFVQVPVFDTAPAPSRSWRTKNPRLPGGLPQSRSIKLYGRLQSGEYILIQTPLAAIEESIAISNRFLVLRARSRWLSAY